jgi:hypothetical protein
MNQPSLQVEQVWAEGGRLGVEVLEDGARVRISGNHDGLVGLARVLLWLAQYRPGSEEVLDLSSFAAFEPGAVLEIHAPR